MRLQSEASLKPLRLPLRPEGPDRPREVLPLAMILRLSWLPALLTLSWSGPFTLVTTNPVRGPVHTVYLGVLGSRPGLGLGRSGWNARAVTPLAYVTRNPRTWRITQRVER